MYSSKYKVVLTEMEHHSMICYGIEFKYNNQLKEIVNSIEFVKWSAGKKTFYVSKNNMSLHKLYTLLNKKGVTRPEICIHKTTSICIKMIEL